MNKPVTYLIAKFAALAAVTIMLAEADAEIFKSLISALVFSCLFLVEFIIIRCKGKPAFYSAVPIIVACGCIYINPGAYYPLIVVMITEICDIFCEGTLFYQIAAVSALLSMFIFSPSTETVITAALTVLFIIVARFMLKKIDRLDEQLSDSKKENTELNKKVDDIKTYVKTLRTTTAMEERNRFAARIHDQLGHSISGSIIMLEAAQLSMDSNPQKAKEIIRSSTENLRDGVDEIRKSLREERPDRSILGLSEINVKLEGFEVTYNIKTHLFTEGDTDNVPQQIWICINENLGEALTNTLKHSSATVFTVKINVMKRLIRVEYVDNGVCDGVIKKGIGLEAIEERTAVCGGKCIFHSGQNGFSITNLFSV